jgi:hypothetical protein
MRLGAEPAAPHVTIDNRLPAAALEAQVAEALARLGVAGSGYGFGRRADR